MAYGPTSTEVRAWTKNVARFLDERLGTEQYTKLSKISNGKLYDFIAQFIKLLDPVSIFVC